MDLFEKAMNVRTLYSRNKVGYKLEDRREFKKVKDTLIKYGMPTKNFDSNLSMLEINEDFNKNTIYGKNDFIAGGYISNTNVLNPPTKEEDFIHELFHMASNNHSDKESLMGCEIRDVNSIFGESLNEGVADYFTSLSVDDYKSRHPVESFFAEYIAKIYGNEIYREFFNGDAIKFYESFKQDEAFIRNFVSFLDNYHRLIQRFYISSESGIIKTETANQISDAFIDCTCEFIRLLQLKKVNEKEFLDKLNEVFMDQENDFVTIINAFFRFSAYKGTENIIYEIREEIVEEGLGL